MKIGGRSRLLMATALTTTLVMLVASFGAPASDGALRMSGAAVSTTTTATTSPESTTTSPSTTSSTSTTTSTTSGSTSTTAIPTSSTTTTVGHKPKPGIPAVPTGGGSGGRARKAPNGPSAPTGAAAVVRSVAALTARIEAIDGYRALRRQVTGDRRIVEFAEVTEAAAQAEVRTAATVAAAAETASGRARDKLVGLALAAYTGSADAPAGASPASGDQQADADAMVAVIFHDAEQEVTAAAVAIGRARIAERAAVAGLDATRRVVVDDGRLLATAAAKSEAAATTASGTAAPTPATGQGPTVLGPALVTAAQLAGWYASTDERSATTVSMGALASDYLAAGRSTGVRADIAFAQSIVETGYFSFPAGGQLVGGNDNYAGIGACDSCAHGWTFPSPAAGVGTQLELLEVYATTYPVATPLLHGSIGIGGCCTTWMALSGRWATNPAYGAEILSVYDRILQWVLPRLLGAAGLG